MTRDAFLKAKELDKKLESIYMMENINKKNLKI